MAHGSTSDPCDAGLTPELILTPTMGGLLLNAFANRMETPIIVLLLNRDNNQHGENENLRLQNLWDAMMVYGHADPTGQKLMTACRVSRPLHGLDESGRPQG